MPTPFLTTVLFVILLVLPIFTDAQCPAVRSCLSSSKTCDMLPVPKRAILPIFKGPTNLRKLRTGVYVYYDFAVMSLILYSKSTRRLVLVDAPDSVAGSNKPDGSRTRITDAILQILSGDKPSRVDIVYSHAHFDHIGASVLVYQWLRRVFSKAPIAIYGTDEIGELIENSVSKRAIKPTTIVKAGQKIVLKIDSGLTLRIRILGGHAGQDLLMHMPRTKKEPGVVMLADIIFPRWAPFPNLATTENVPNFIKAHNEVLKMDFKYFVGGHTRIGDKNDVATALRYIEHLLEEAKRSLKTVTPAQLAAVGAGKFTVPGTPQYRNVWYISLNAGRNIQAANCARKMIQRWGCLLGGVAETAWANCFTAITYRYIDV